MLNVHDESFNGFNVIKWSRYLFSILFIFIFGYLITNLNAYFLKTVNKENFEKEHSSQREYHCLDLTFNPEY